MEVLQQFIQAPNSNVREVLLKNNVSILYLPNFKLQEKLILQAIKAKIAEIAKDPQLSLVSLTIYSYLIDSKENTYKDPKVNKLEFLASIKTEVVKLLTPLNCEIHRKEAITLLHQYFLFYATYEDYYIEGLKFFSLFPDFLKEEKFNPMKAYIFYFAYQTKKYNSKEVQNILAQTLLNAEIMDSKTYLDFCMYCFYRGLYCLEKRDYYMTSYFYCMPIQIGLKAKNGKLINNFTAQMLRSLCFLRILSNFRIKEAINYESRFRSFDELTMIEYQDVSFCINFITKSKIDLKDFRDFIKEEDENIKKCSLQGLKQAAEEELIFQILKEILKVYKKIKMTKIAQSKKLEVRDIMKVLKKKVLAGEINVKYDESEDIIETFDVDPGAKERVKKTAELYEKIINGNKNMFNTLKNKKLDQLSGKATGKEMEMMTNFIANGGEEFDEGMIGMEEEYDE